MTFADYHSLGDAEESLLQAALMEKGAFDHGLSVHRLIQAIVIYRMSASERTKYLNAATELLGQSLIEPWTKETNYELKPWTKEAWLLYECCLPHVIHLVQQSKRHGIHTENRQKLGELLIPCIG